MLKTKLIYLYILVFALFSNSISAQQAETVIETDFAIRDFCISKDSIFYIKKRDVIMYSKITKQSKHYFIGGYGLKINTQENTNSVLTVSNELIDTIASVRFYNKKVDEFDAVFYYRKAKILDFLDVPEAKIFILSLTNNKIIFVDYKDSPEFYKTIELTPNVLTRKLRFANNILYFATDKGEIFEYNFLSYEKTVLYKGNTAITDFIIDGNSLIYATIEGDVTKIDLNSKRKTKLNIKNNFISVLMQYASGKLICGSWDGTLYVVDSNKFSIEKELKFHNRAILQIKKDIDNNIYSSSLDRTIKKWQLKLNK